jgi:tRNA-Thr(GGU) m(6)t(6)A37 methyltransferase TsaA
MTPIGTVRSTRKAVSDDNWDKEEAFIEVDESSFSEESMVGLSDFSHVEVIFYLDRVLPEKIEKAARHPRNNPDWPKVGVFAQRGKNRPNQIGATICRILKVDRTRLHVEGLDAVDGTPVLDLKPWVDEYSPRGRFFQPAWVSELMRGYWTK